MSKRPTGYRSGDWLIICDRCGFTIMASETAHHYDDLITCKECYETRHPQELLRPRKDRIVPPFLRPEPEDSYIEHTPFTVAITGVSGTGSVSSVADGGLGIGIGLSGNSATASLGNIDLSPCTKLLSISANNSMTMPVSATWPSVRHNGSQWVAVGMSGVTNYAAYSSDGINWTQSTTSNVGGSDLVWCSGGGGFWWATNSAAQTGFKSTDGDTWTTQTGIGYFIGSRSQLGQSESIIDVNGTMVANVYMSNVNYFLSSTTGATWSTHARLPTGSNTWQGFAKNSTTIVTVGDFGAIYYSPIADMYTTNWTAATGYPGGVGWGQVKWNGTYFIAIPIQGNGPGNVGARSLDGATWESITLPDELTYDVVSGGLYGYLSARSEGILNLPLFYADGPSSLGKTAMSCDNGSTWTLKTIPDGYWGASASDGSKFVGIRGWLAGTGGYYSTGG